MAYLKIPVRSDLPAYEFEIELEQTVYFLSFNWNARMQKWFMDIKDQNQNVLIQGIKIMTAWPLIERFKDSRLPQGQFFVVDTANENLDPGIDQFGLRHLLMYRESTTIDE